MIERAISSAFTSRLRRAIWNERSSLSRSKTERLPLRLIQQLIVLNSPLQLACAVLQETTTNGTNRQKSTKRTPKADRQESKNAPKSSKFKRSEKPPKIAFVTLRRAPTSKKELQAHPSLCKAPVMRCLPRRRRRRPQGPSRTWLHMASNVREKTATRNMFEQ